MYLFSLGTKTRIKVKSDQENNKYYVNEDVTITAEISNGSNILCTTWQKLTMNESVSLDTSLSKYIVTRNNYKHTLTIKNCSELDQGAYFLLAACTYNLEVCSNTIQLDAIQGIDKHFFKELNTQYMYLFQLTIETNKLVMCTYRP